MTTRRPGSGLEAPENGAASRLERNRLSLRSWRTCAQDSQGLSSAQPPRLPCVRKAHTGMVFLPQADPPVTSCIRQPLLLWQSESRLCFHTRAGTLQVMRQGWFFQMYKVANTVATLLVTWQGWGRQAHDQAFYTTSAS